MFLPSFVQKLSMLGSPEFWKQEILYQNFAPFSGLLGIYIYIYIQLYIYIICIYIYRFCMFCIMYVVNGLVHASGCVLFNLNTIFFDTKITGTTMVAVHKAGDDPKGEDYLTRPDCE